MFCSPIHTDEVLSSLRGNHPKVSTLIRDEEFQMKAREFVRKNAYRKGEPNLTVREFAGWVREGWQVDICDDTARRWLHKLGFSRVNHSKGVYFDGHERADVVEYRSKYLDKLAEYNHEAPNVGRPIIRVYHDESTFYANADQSYHWSDGQFQVLKQKSLGQAVMISDFIDEVSGFLREGKDMARVALEHQTEGYFTNPMFLNQVSTAIDIFERKHPQSQGCFLFDNAPSHKKVAADALNADKLNVRPGGKQPCLRDTMWDGRVQKMQLPDGRPKGMKLILEERGVCTDGMVAEKLREKLQTFEDFKTQKSLLEEMVEARGHICMFIPKFHCELNPIERVWCHAKKHTRANCNGSIVRLRKLIPEGFETVTNEMIKKFFVTCRDFEKAYREGHTTESVDAAVKQYKSHRRVFNTTV